MKASLLLCDAAQAVDNKLFVLGGGIALVGPGPVNFAVAIDVKVPWSGAHTPHSWRLDLLDADGDPVDPGNGPVSISGEFRVAPNLEAQPGMTLGWPFAVNVMGLPLADGSQYQWTLSIDGTHDESWYLDFWTRPAAQAQAV